ncbi:uncharacterized protein LOC128952625 [Oppia nitens]|uniref:uncharacterized protein LOC128952625 n=1 Tax=Oppia nitens TaxID=1686743 RepID=UPI0023DACDC2|nr:uncharacterized protein LOC128952625 [Oppia nitens]
MATIGGGDDDDDDLSPVYDKKAELIGQYSADCLPDEVKDIIPDFFMESVRVTEQMETMARYEYVSDAVVAATTTTTDDDFMNGAAASAANYGLDSGGGVDDIGGDQQQQHHGGLPELKNILDNLDDIPDDLVKCSEVFDDYFREGCGCHRKCHERFPKFMAFEAHLDALDADQYCPDHINHQHLLLLGAMNSLVQNHPTTIAKEHRPKDRKNARTQFRFRGQEVCRKFFLFVFGCGEKRVKNVMKQFLTTGIAPKAHESAQMTKDLIKSDPNDQRRDAVIFIKNYAQQHALQLSGRYVCPDRSVKDLFLLPAVANMTRKYIYDQYMICCRDLHRDGVSFALWGALWDWLCPNVMVPKNKYEICRDCREHQYILSKPEPLNDNRKLRSTEKFIHHLSLQHHELAYYKQMVELARQSLIQCQGGTTSAHGQQQSSPATMHYTFDWYTSVSLPYSSRLSSVYFHSAYKVSLFGVCIEPIEKFYLYIVPEFIIGSNGNDKLQDITVSLINHFFTNYALSESQTYIHFSDNSVQQSKNNHILSYFMWRSVTGLNEKIVLSYMPKGHSRSWNDLFMGVFKKKFRNCDINSLKDVYMIAERCCGPTESITPVLVGNDDGDVEFPLLDWNDKFAHINNLDANILNSNNHFEISNEVPGLVLCRRMVNSDTISYQLIDNEHLDHISGELPECLELESMTMERKLYLYENIRQFTPTAFQSLICADPEARGFQYASVGQEYTGKSIFTPKNNNKRSKSDNKKSSSDSRRRDNRTQESSSGGTAAAGGGASGGAKRKRAGQPKCSYCKEVGHRERIFGKTTCPKKKRDSLLLKPKPPNAGAAAAAAVAESSTGAQTHHELAIAAVIMANTDTVGAGDHHQLVLTTTTSEQFDDTTATTDTKNIVDDDDDDERVLPEDDEEEDNMSNG